MPVSILLFLQPVLYNVARVTRLKTKLVFVHFKTFKWLTVSHAMKFKNFGIKKFLMILSSPTFLTLPSTAPNNFSHIIQDNACTAYPQMQGL